MLLFVDLEGATQEKSAMKVTLRLNVLCSGYDCGLNSRKVIYTDAVFSPAIAIVDPAFDAPRAITRQEFDVADNSMHVFLQELDLKSTEVSQWKKRLETAGWAANAGGVS